MGRTGKFFALEHFGVQPDVLITAKGIASGMPLSALATRKDLMAKWTPGSHGGTYGGNAVKGVLVDNVASTVTQKTVNGISVGFVTVPAGNHDFVVSYGSGLYTLTPTSTVTITPTPPSPVTRTPTPPALPAVWGLPMTTPSWLKNTGRRMPNI